MDFMICFRMRWEEYDAYVHDSMNIMNMWNDEMIIAWNKIMNIERKTVWVELSLATHVQDQFSESLIGLGNNTAWVEVPSA
jgi:hypothetical protein